MITQRRQTYSSREFRFIHGFYVSISMQNILKGNLQPKLKGASIWPFNAYNIVATGRVLSHMIIKEQRCTSIVQ